MSEFQTTKDISRLIGSVNQQGLLTTKIRQDPFSLILLDEIEKRKIKEREERKSCKHKWKVDIPPGGEQGKYITGIYELMLDDSVENCCFSANS